MEVYNAWGMGFYSRRCAPLVLVSLYLLLLQVASLAQLLPLQSPALALLCPVQLLLLHGLYATAAPQSHLPQLVLPDHVSCSCCSASITSTFASLLDCIHFSCCPQIASASPAATGLHPCTASAVLESSSPCNCPSFSCKVRGSSKVQGRASLWSVSPPNPHTLPLSHIDTRLKS